MTLLYYDPILLEHKTGRHPERPERLVQVVRHLERTGLDQRCKRPRWESVSPERLSRVHSLEYAAELRAICERGGGRVEADTVCSSRSYEVAAFAAGAVCDAVERVMTTDERRALCLVRPPGHHALRHSPMGFCLLNSVALGARTATAEFGVDRVLIVDWDVHHGNGTQAAFWEDSQVGFVSIHRWPFYPGTGSSEETGSGSALGTKLNLPVEFGTSRAKYLALFQAGLERMAQKMKPQLILLSAGFDSHRDDPVGSLGLETEDFIALTRSVMQVADAYANGRLVSTLEGGYNAGVLAGCIAVHLGELLGRDPPHNATGKVTPALL